MLQGGLLPVLFGLFIILFLLWSGRGRLTSGGRDGDGGGFGNFDGGGDGGGGGD